MKLTNELCDEFWSQLSLEKKRIIIAVTTELARGEEKHPVWPKDFIHRASFVTEEAGELAKAANEYMYENGRYYDMSKEAIHTAAIAVRFAVNLPDLPYPKITGPAGENI
jgi:hypothetical protein